MSKDATGRKKQTTTAIVINKDSDDEDDALDTDEGDENVTDGNMTIQDKKAAMMRGQLDGTCYNYANLKRSQRLRCCAYCNKTCFFGVVDGKQISQCYTYHSGKLRGTKELNKIAAGLEKWADKKAAEVFKNHLYALGQD
ncbi:hypothetical protein KEM56_001184 [Ascosphaera pollenicola]|nr:hypothetical protein KEM56_001184 [Ascosphaera pollenicola]